MKSTYSEIGMQDTTLRLRRTRVIELPAVRQFGKHAYKGIPWEGTFFFPAPRDMKITCLDIAFSCLTGLRYLGALTWVSTGEGSEPGIHSLPCL